MSSERYEEKVRGVEVYTTMEPCMSQTVEYRGLVVASKVKSRNIFSDIGSCFVGCCGGEIKDLSKLTNDIRQTGVLDRSSDKTILNHGLSPGTLSLISGRNF